MGNENRGKTYTVYDLEEREIEKKTAERVAQKKKEKKRRKK